MQQKGCKFLGCCGRAVMGLAHLSRAGRAAGQYNGKPSVIYAKWKRWIIVLPCLSRRYVCCCATFASLAPRLHEATFLVHDSQLQGYAAHLLSTVLR